MPPRVHIFNNIRATQDTARIRTELFYGASSPFSLLQHLEVHLPAQASPAAYSEVDTDEVQDGGESIKSYSYQSIVFEDLTTPMQHASHFAIISYAVAKASLRNFLLTASHRMPFLDSNNLCNAFERLYGHGDSTPLDTPDRAIIVIALAMGATPTINNPCRQNFLTQARAEAESMMYNISLKTLQATLMMAQCEFEAGNPNICYLRLGSAIRKAFAAGIHRASSLEAKQTMWALYCDESLICFQFGRQFGLIEENIAMPMHEKLSYMSFFVRLCTIVRSAYRIYCLNGTIAADLSWAKTVHGQLCEFSSMLKADMAVEIGGQPYALTGDKLSWHITLSYGKSASCFGH